MVDGVNNDFNSWSEVTYTLEVKTLMEFGEKLWEATKEQDVNARTLDYKVELF